MKAFARLPCLTRFEDVPDLPAVVVQTADSSLVADFVQPSVDDYREPLFAFLHDLAFLRPSR